MQENRVNRASKQSIVLQIQSVRNRESKLLDMFLDGKCTQELYEQKLVLFKEEIKKTGSWTRTKWQCVKRRYNRLKSHN